MTANEIAKKYVYGNHDALTDNQEVLDMERDILELLESQKNLYTEMLEMLKLIVDRMDENGLGHMSAVGRANILIKKATEL